MVKMRSGMAEKMWCYSTPHIHSAVEEILGGREEKDPVRRVAEKRLVHALIKPQVLCWGGLGSRGRAGKRRRRRRYGRAREGWYLDHVGAGGTGRPREGWC